MIQLNNIKYLKIILFLSVLTKNNMTRLAYYTLHIILQVLLSLKVK